MNESECRLALADFLRKRRICLSPAEVGLPACRQLPADSWIAP